ncbi:MAG: response regulator [Chloroflexi bacterium]|nr:response regulator [Chloroflexota bacterium]
MSEKLPLVMIVDDDWMNREVLEAYLHSAGYQVVSAHSGEQALEIASKTPPDLVLLDVRMHGLGGLEVCRRLKAQASTAHTPVLIATALAGEEEKQQAIAAGADDFVLKPLDATMMLQRVKSFLRLKQLAEREARLRVVLARHVSPQTAEMILAELNDSSLA